MLNKTSKLTQWLRAFRLIRDAVPGLTALWGLLLVLQGVLPGVNVWLTKLTIDSFVYARNHKSDEAAFGETVTYLVLTGLTLLAAEILLYASDWVRTAQAEKFADHLKELLHTKSSEVDLEFYESPEYHDLMEQARGESQSKPLALLESLGAVVQNAITIAGFGALLFGYGYWMPLLLVAGTLPGLAVAMYFDRVYHTWWRATAVDRRWLAYFDSMMSHAAAAAEMRLFNLSGRFKDKYQVLRGRLRGERLSFLRRQLTGKTLAGGLALATSAIAIGWVAQQVFYDLATLGDLAVFYQIFTRGQGLMRALLGGVGQTVSNGLYLESLFAFLDLKPRLYAPEAPVPFPERIREGIRFRDVTFRYPREKRAALENFDLFIPAGRIVAIVGVNGAGKSTLIKLLARFYDPQEGAIEIDGVDLRRFDPVELRRGIAVLFQFPMQFHETAADSIALGDAGAEPRAAEIERAAQLAGAHGFIARLADKYETLLGKWFVKGSELSGGEWQRVALARAYYRKSPLVVLDEPTSFMDSWSEADWFDRFRKLAAGRTGLIITHRFTIAMRADVIHVVDGGRLVESGSHRELARGGGLYAESWAMQKAAGGEDVETREAATA